MNACDSMLSHPGACVEAEAHLGWGSLLAKESLGTSV